MDSDTTLNQMQCFRIGAPAFVYDVLELVPLRLHILIFDQMRIAFGVLNASLDQVRNVSAKDHGIDSLVLIILAHRNEAINPLPDSLNNNALIR